MFNGLMIVQRWVDRRGGIARARRVEDERRKVLLTWAWHFHPDTRSEKLTSSETKQFLRREMVEVIIMELFQAESLQRGKERSRVSFLI